ncbi:MAG: histone deacetylase [Acidobacteria bacterium]|nr:histone deacetylase [Acidobacteriota bacterium]
MLPYKLVYHSGYDLNLGDHVFPTQKYRLVRERLLEERIAAEEDFVEPEPSPEEDLLRVHEPGWIRRLKTGTLSFSEILRLEMPYSRDMVRACLLAAGGTTLAARRALRDGVCINLGGGFHHAFPGHGEGFCAIHDIAVAIRRWQAEGLVERAMIVDCDVHHGNGTAAIFAHDPRVFTLSIHQFNNYPAHKPASDVDIHLADETGNEEYLARLRAACVPALSRHRPHLMVYVAGADPYYQDQLGGLSLNLEGLRARDRLVLASALMARIPVAVVLAGGYAVELEDTVTIHVNTARVARDVLERVGWNRREPS